MSVTGHTDNVLRLPSITRASKGMYQCFVRNDHESAQATAELRLGGRCELPLGLSLPHTQRFYWLVNPLNKGFIDDTSIRVFSLYTYGSHFHEQNS